MTSALKALFREHANLMVKDGYISCRPPRLESPAIARIEVEKNNLGETKDTLYLSANLREPNRTWNTALNIIVQEFHSCCW